MRHPRGIEKSTTRPVAITGRIGSVVGPQQLAAQTATLVTPNDVAAQASSDKKWCLGAHVSADDDGSACRHTGGTRKATVRRRDARTVAQYETAERHDNRAQCQSVSSSFIYCCSSRSRSSRRLGGQLTMRQRRKVQKRGQWRGDQTSASAMSPRRWAHRAIDVCRERVQERGIEVEPVSVRAAAQRRDGVRVVVRDVPAQRARGGRDL